MRQASLAAELEPAARKQLPVGESVARGALALLSTQPLTWAASLLTTIVVPRLLGADALGEFTIAFTISNLASTATSLGVSEYLVRRTAQSPGTLRQDAGVALLVQTVPTVLGVLLIMAAAPFGVFPLVDSRVLYIALVAMLNVPPQTVLLSTFRGRERHKQYAWFNAAGVIVGQGGGALILFLGSDVIGYAAVTSAALVGTTLVAWKLSGVRPTLPLWGAALFSQCREFVWGGFPFLTWMLTLSVTSGADRVVLGFFVPTAEVGWYAAAYRIFAIPVFIPTLVMNPLFPALSRSVHAPETIRRTITQAMRIVLVLMVPMAAGMVVVAPAVPRLLGWPSDFQHASPLIAILSLQLPIIAVDMVFGAVLFAIGRQGRWVTVSVGATIAKLLIDLLAIPLAENFGGNGAIGASIVSLVAEVAMFVGAMILTPNELLDSRMGWDALRILVAGAATIVLGMIALTVSLPLAIFCGATCYIAVIWLSRAVTLDDVRPLAARMSSVLPGRD